MHASFILKFSLGLYTLKGVQQDLDMCTNAPFFGEHAPNGAALQFWRDPTLKCGPFQGVGLFVKKWLALFSLDCFLLHL